MPIDTFSQWNIALYKTGFAAKWRNIVVLAGNENWQKNMLEESTKQLLHFLGSNEKLPLGICFNDGNAQDLSYLEDRGLQYADGKNYTKFLGTEQQIIIFSAMENFDINAFAALSGCLVRGGLLFLLMPEQASDKNHLFGRYFGQRFWQILREEKAYIFTQSNDQETTVYSQKSLSNSLTSFTVTEQQKQVLFDYDCITLEQEHAVKAMLTVLRGHRDRPLVITADRGRGKSTALAIATCEMLSTAKQTINIVITAASRHSLNIYFEHIKKQLPQVTVTNNTINYNGSSVEFFPIDHLLEHKPTASILMIDEAASIPLYLLEGILASYHRLIFASTVHGYEGAGRGFAIKFKSIIDNYLPQWRALHIEQPIRWAKNDPLERLVNKACLLNASLAQLENQGQLWNKADLCVSEVSKQSLVDSEELLQQVFSILVTAHYQTSPNDLILLLDNEAISLVVLTSNKLVIGVAMIISEGGVNDALVAQINNNQRRLRDQFLPQSLLTHCGFEESFRYKYQRIMRIAIHPELQGNGYGHYFLDNIVKLSKQKGFDFIGSSFAGNDTLLKFWLTSAFVLARVGFKKDKASGEHSCLIIRALHQKVTAIEQQITGNFYQQFDYWLTDEFKALPARFVWQVLNAAPTKEEPQLSIYHRNNVLAFIAGKRQYSPVVYSLHAWLLSHCQDDYDEGVLPLINRIFQKHSHADICQRYGLVGKKSLNQHIINYIDDSIQSR